MVAEALKRGVADAIAYLEKNNDEADEEKKGNQAEGWEFDDLWPHSDDDRVSVPIVVYIVESFSKKWWQNKTARK